MKGLLGWSVFLALTVAAGRADAEGASEPELGEGGRFAIAAERLFGYDYSRVTETPTGGLEQKSTTNGFSFLNSAFGPTGGIFSVPRLAVDAFVSRSLSVGGALGAMYTSESVSGTTTNLTLSGYLAEVRIGYLVPISPAVALWPRVGSSFVYYSIGSGGSTSNTVLAAVVDVPFAFTVAPRVVILFGPTLDVSFYGRIKTTPATGGGSSTSTPTQEIEAGARAGLLVLL